MEDYKGDMNCRAYNASDLSSDHSDTDTGAGRGGAVLTAVSVCDRVEGMGGAVLTAVCICV